MRRSSTTRIERFPACLAASVFAALFVSACFRGDGAASGPAEDERAYAIQIDRSNNGAVQSGRTADGAALAPSRRLSFEMVGFATGGRQDDEAAVRQAAILDAFERALVEARRSRGQSTERFTARFGPRLTVVHRRTASGSELEINLLGGGGQTQMILGDGRLRSPPVDMETIRRIFAETNGEFSLLESRRSQKGDRCEARVACYRPAGIDDPRLAGGDSAE